MNDRSPTIGMIVAPPSPGSSSSGGAAKTSFASERSDRKTSGGRASA
jgi:hypothetical protein